MKNIILYATAVIMLGYTSTAMGFEIKGVSPGIIISDDAAMGELVGVRSICVADPHLGNGFVCFTRTPRGSEKHLTLANQEVQLFVSLGKDKDVQQFRFVSKSSAFVPLMSALKSKFGEPTQVNESVVTTGMGVEHSNVEMVWISGDITMTLKKFDGKITESSLVVSTPAFMKRIEDKVRADKDDI